MHRVLRLSAAGPTGTCKFWQQTYVNVTLGGQQLALLLDSASSTLVVSSPLCDSSCPSDIPRWDPALGAPTGRARVGAVRHRGQQLARPRVSGQRVA